MFHMRFDYPTHAPGLTAQLRQVAAQLHQGPLDPHLTALVELRVSQINGCAFCIDRHAREALRAGVPLGVVIGLCAWRDDHRIDSRCRAALALAEASCDPHLHAEREAAYAALDGMLTPAEMVHLIMVIAVAGAWNRIASASQHQPVDAPWPLADATATYAPSKSAIAVPTLASTHELHPTWRAYRDLLLHTPTMVVTLTRALPPSVIHAAPGPQQWSVHDIAAHLVQTEMTSWVPRLRHVIDQAPGPLPRVDPQAHRGRFTGESIDALAARLMGLRHENLRQVDDMNLDDDRLSLSGEHPEQGPVQARHLLATWCMHDLSHIAQILHTVGPQYVSQVGPLAVYLRICRPRDPSA